VRRIAQNANKASDGGHALNHNEYNELKVELALRDAMRMLASAVLGDDMELVIRRLVECEVLPPGTRPLRPSMLHQ
jgi:hypothetical protein